jgi:uncharacterized protein (TIGR03067 family)
MKRKPFLMVSVAALALLVVVYPFAHRRAAWLKSLQPFQGRWTGLYLSDDGRIVPDGIEFHVEGDRVTLRLASGARAVSYVIDAHDPTRDPPWIDWTAFDGAKKIASHKCVYRSDGDTLIINIGFPGHDRPVEAKRAAGPGYGAAIWKRVR